MELCIAPSSSKLRTGHASSFRAGRSSPYGDGVCSNMLDRMLITARELCVGAMQSHWPYQALFLAILRVTGSSSSLRCSFCVSAVTSMDPLGVSPLVLDSG